MEINLTNILATYPYIIGLLLLAIVLVFVMMRAKKEEVVEPTPLVVPGVSHDMAKRLTENYTEVYNSALRRDKVLISSLYLAASEGPLEQSIAAIGDLVNAENSSYQVLIGQLVTRSVLRCGNTIVNDTITYGRYIASLYNINLDDYVVDLPYDAPIKNPMLLISVTLVFLTTNGLIGQTSNIES